MRLMNMNYNLCGKYIEITNEGEVVFKLSLQTSVEPYGVNDIDEEILEFTKVNEKKFVWITKSNNWDKKEYSLTITEDGILYNVCVYGNHKIDKVRYFSDKSLYEAGFYFIPSVLGDGVDNRIFTTAQSGTISMGYLTPPPMCFPFLTEGQNSWVGVGLICDENCYNFDSFKFVSKNNSMEFNVDLYEYTECTHSIKLPAILFTSGKDKYDVLHNYSMYHFNNGYCKMTENKNEDWWYGPLFCGWGQQMRDNPEDPYSLSTQEYYKNLSERISDRGLKPTAIIVDDKWQGKYGEALPDKKKFPDLRSFCDEQHKQGKKVMLWFKSWSCEGLNNDECVTLWSQPYGADPTNPKYIERMKKTIHYLISDDEGCCNCDGFKIDFANCMPLGRDLQTYEGVYGIELLKRLIRLIYECTKSEKADALINNSCCHPYFYEVTDQVRLHDYCMMCRNSSYALELRSNLFGSVMSGKLIDTDGAGDASRRDAMRYISKSVEIGVSDLYIIDSNVLQEEDWEKIKYLWNEYNK